MSEKNVINKVCSCRAFQHDMKILDQALNSCRRDKGLTPVVFKHVLRNSISNRTWHNIAGGVTGEVHPLRKEKIKIPVESNYGIDISIDTSEDNMFPVEVDSDTGEVSVRVPGTDVKLKKRQISTGFSFFGIEAEAAMSSQRFTLSAALPVGINGPGITSKAKASIYVPSVSTSGPYPTGPGVLIDIFSEAFSD